MRIEIAGLVAGMVVMRTGLLHAGSIAMPLRVKVARRVAGMVVVRSGLLHASRVAMAMRVEVAGLVAGMVVVGTGAFLGHVVLLLVDEASTEQGNVRFLRDSFSTTRVHAEFDLASLCVKPPHRHRLGLSHFSGSSEDWIVR
jgi:hypothetical protein